MRIACQQTILIKYHALFVIFEKAAKFEIIVCSKLWVALYGLICLLHIFKGTPEHIYQGSKNYEPRSGCSFRSSLIWVHTVGILCYQSMLLDERADIVLS